MKVKRLAFAGMYVLTQTIVFGLVAFSASSVDAAPSQQVPLVALAAKKVGVRQCLPAISKIAEQLTAGATEQDIVINWNNKTPNNSPFFSLTGMGAGAKHAVLSITAMPTKPGNCALMIERVSSSTESCSTIGNRDLASFQGGKLIDGITVYQNPAHPEETFTLIQNSESCTVVLRQAMFEWPPSS